MTKRRRALKAIKTGLRWLGRALLALVVLTVLLSAWATWRTEVGHPVQDNVVNDVTQLNPIAVDRVLAPTTLEEIVAAVREHQGPIAIGGGRYSMGGQTATEGALHLDMRGFNQVLLLDPANRTITVQPGIRWREIQERIDPFDLSVKIMQTYSNFTVGGSLSVNVHGRYIGLGPLVLSVRSIKLVLADGTLVRCSPTERSDIFYGALGGYGGLGVIVEATLDLVPNVRVARQAQLMPLADYGGYFAAQVRDDPAVVFHNADIYPDAYDTVNAVSFVHTEAPVTVPERLIPKDRSYRVNRLAYTVISEFPGGKWLRQHLLDPLLYRGEQVEWRNYEASYDVAELEPGSREAATYVLQEYFVPVARLDEFVPRMAEVLKRHEVNVINVSIRHARPDPGTLLAWAPEEVFAFVLYYKQDTDEVAREQVGVWTRELIDAVLGVGGRYYLPYQPQATEAQFQRAYARAPEFFALKRKLDPANKFRNKLWDKYYRSQLDAAQAPLEAEVRVALRARPGYARDEGQTFLTHPEWYIVYSSDEYADWLATRTPTAFPYLASIGQYWRYYGAALDLTGDRYPFNWGYNVMLGVIGASFSVEYTVKFLYENTLGRITAWTLDDGELTAEDRYAHEVAADYGRFIHIRPWYEYRFATRLGALWSELPWWGPHPLRSWERKLALSAEYAAKAVYATLIEIATRSAFAPQDDRMQLVAAGWTDALASSTPALASLDTVSPHDALLAAPRYDEFRDLMLNLAARDAPLTIKEIAGNDEIFLTGVAPAEWRYAGGAGRVTSTLPLPTDAARMRVTMRVPVRELLPTLRALLGERQFVVDHIYDY